MRKILLLLLLGKQKQIFRYIKLKGRIYKVEVTPYESSEDILEKAASSGVFTASISER